MPPLENEAWLSMPGTQCLALWCVFTLTSDRFGGLQPAGPQGRLAYHRQCATWTPGGKKKVLYICCIVVLLELVRTAGIQKLGARIGPRRWTRAQEDGGWMHGGRVHWGSYCKLGKNSAAVCLAAAMPKA